MNRAGRRAYAKKLGIEVPKGTQDSSEPTKKVVYVAYTKRSKSGVKYNKFSKQIVPITNNPLKRIFSK